MRVFLSILITALFLQYFYLSFYQYYRRSYERLQYSPNDCDPDYYRFSLLKKNSTTFLIHGLWIEECSQCPDCGYPSSCNPNCQFNVTKLSPIYNRLQRFWFPADDPRNNTLLSHEWCKHGTCTNKTELNISIIHSTSMRSCLRKDLLSLCNYHTKECYFILDKNFTITNSTKSGSTNQL